MLPPCPFCGSTASLYLDFAPPFDGYPSFAVIMCLRCRSVGPVKDSTAAAIIAWNRRPFSSPKPAALSSPISKN